MFDELKTTGITFLRNQVYEKLIKSLHSALDDSFELHRKIQQQQDNEIDTSGVALNVLPESSSYVLLLQMLIDDGTIKGIEDNYFESKFILNSFSALDNKPNKPNFSATIHRDLRAYSHGLPLMLNMLVMLDDFTKENGATLLLPYSHLKKDKPTDEYFHENCISAIGKAGDILLFDSNIWHCSAVNTTQERRRAIPITFTKSFMKQLFDYPRAFGNNSPMMHSTELEQLIGYHSRVPSTLEEWYLPSDKRFYKKNQD